MSDQLPSPKRRLRAVYSVAEDPAQRSERVIYQLEDTGHDILRLRPTVRVAEEDGAERILYRVDAFSRLTGAHLGKAEALAEPDSAAEFAAVAHQFQSGPFRDAMDELSAVLIERLADRERAAAEAAVAEGGRRP